MTVPEREAKAASDYRKKVFGRAGLAAMLKGQAKRRKREVSKWPEAKSSC